MYIYVYKEGAAKRGGGIAKFYSYKIKGGGGGGSVEVVLTRKLEALAIVIGGHQKFSPFKRVGALSLTLF